MRAYVCHGLDAMSQSKNLIVLQEELTKEERVFSHTRSSFKRGLAGSYGGPRALVSRSHVQAHVVTCRLHYVVMQPHFGFNPSQCRYHKAEQGQTLVDLGNEAKISRRFQDAHNKQRFKKNFGDTQLVNASTADLELQESFF